MKHKQHKIKDKLAIQGQFNYIRFIINVCTKNAKGEKIHFLNYSDNAIHFAINEIEKTLNKLKKEITK